MSDSFRVSSDSFHNNLLGRISDLNRERIRFMNQGSTGQRITHPSDDPAAMNNVLEFQTEKRALAQFNRNATQAEVTAQVGHNTLTKLLEVNTRASELAVQGDNALGADRFESFALEMNGLLEQGVNLLNAKHLKDSLFAGNQTDVQPFQVTRDVNGKITAVTYNGSTNASAKFEIGDGKSLSPRLDGADAQGLLTVVTDLMQLRDAMDTKDPAAVSALHSNIHANEDKLTSALSKLGSKIKEVEIAKGDNKERFNLLENYISTEVDADFAETVLKASQVQSKLEVAMMTNALASQLKLIDYIR